MGMPLDYAETVSDFTGPAGGYQGFISNKDAEYRFYANDRRSIIKALGSVQYSLEFDAVEPHGDDWVNTLHVYPDQIYMYEDKPYRVINEINPAAVAPPLDAVNWELASIGEHELTVIV